jgi:hypothetical protein
MEGRLNNIQLEILKLFSTNYSKEELIEIKKLLQTYLAHKVVLEADKSFVEKKYTDEVFNEWKEEHYRKKAS